MAEPLHQKVEIVLDDAQLFVFELLRQIVDQNVLAFLRRQRRVQTGQYGSLLEAMV